MTACLFVCRFFFRCEGQLSQYRTPYRSGQRAGGCAERGNKSVCLCLVKKKVHFFLSFFLPLSLQLPGVLPAGRWRALRRLRVGGDGLCLLLPAGQPGGHLGHQPPGSERPDATPAPRGEVPAAL